MDNYVQLVDEIKDSLWPTDWLEKEEINQFWNNFFFFFDKVKEWVEAVLVAKKDLHHWVFEEFVKENEKLVEEIKELLVIRKKIMILMVEYKTLLKQGRFEEAERFEKETCLELLHILLWKKLKPLLEQAFNKLIVGGFSGEELMG